MTQRMELINRYRYLFAAIAMLALILQLRDGSKTRFRYDAERWAEPSFSSANVIVVEEIASLPGDKLIVLLNPEDSLPVAVEAAKTYISADSVLSRKYGKIIRNHKGSVLLYDANISVSARVWMVLSQTGHENIYIIAKDRSNESLKERIIADTIILQP